MPSARCFVGVALSGALVDALGRCSEAIVTSDPAWRSEKWVRPENLHLTLHFMGDVEESDLATLRDSLRDAIEPRMPFDLPFDRLKTTPRQAHARTLWAQYSDPEGRCARLAREVARASGAQASDHGRPFTPHVTLCRARTPRRLNADAIASGNDVLTAAETVMSVASATLFSSRLTPRGPVYHVVAEWSLRGH